MIGRLARTTRLLVAAAFLFTPAVAQEKKPPKELRPNDPSTCPYCLGDPERMRQAGIVSHGGFDFARTNTAAFPRAYGDIRIDAGTAVGTAQNASARPTQSMSNNVPGQPDLRFVPD